MKMVERMIIYKYNQVLSLPVVVLAKLRCGSLSLGLLVSIIITTIVITNTVQVKTALAKDFKTVGASPPLKTRTFPTWFCRNHQVHV